MQVDEIVEDMKVEDEIDSLIDGHKRETAEERRQREEALHQEEEALLQLERLQKQVDAMGKAINSYFQ